MNEVCDGYDFLTGASEGARFLHRQGVPEIGAPRLAAAERGGGVWQRDAGEPVPAGNAGGEGPRQRRDHAVAAHSFDQHEDLLQQELRPVGYA